MVKLIDIFENFFIKNIAFMTKSEMINEIVNKTGVDKLSVQTSVEAMMRVIKNTMAKNESIYLRGFGSFVPKKRAEKMGRVIKRNTTILIPEHYVPTFKPSKKFADKIKKSIKV